MYIYYYISYVPISKSHHHRQFRRNPNRVSGVICTQPTSDGKVRYSLEIRVKTNSTQILAYVIICRFNVSHISAVPRVRLTNYVHSIPFAVMQRTDERCALDVRWDQREDLRGIRKMKAIGALAQARC